MMLMIIDENDKIFSTDPVKIAGVPILSLCGQMVADAGRLADSKKCYGHEERSYIVGPQKPLVHLRQVIQESEQWR